VLAQVAVEDVAHGSERSVDTPNLDHRCRISVPAIKCLGDIRSRPAAVVVTDSGLMEKTMLIPSRSRTRRVVCNAAGPALALGAAGTEAHDGRRR
jgi:hypothetical protein